MVRKQRFTPDRLPSIETAYSKADEDGTNPGSYWWRAPEATVHAAIFDAIRHIDQTQQFKYRDLLRAVRLYGSIGVSSLAPGLYNQPDPSVTQRLRYNIIATTVDTSTALISKDRPRVVAMTEGASFRLQKQAKLLSKFWYGLFDQEGVYEDAPAVFRDGALTGAGAVKVSKEQKRLRIHRVFMDELLWDDADAVTGNPRCLYHRVPIARERALELWPEHAVDIKRVEVAKAPYGEANHDAVADLIWLVQAWHLPSCDGAEDGWDVLAIENVTLHRAPYKHSMFPVVFCPYGAKPPKGLIPEGLARKLTGIQISINRHLDTIEAALRLLGVPRIFVDDLSDISVSQINNLVGAIVKYAHGAEKPFVDNSNVIPPDLWQQVQFLIQSGFEIASISRLSASGVKPEGLNSGKALREYTDIESVSFSTIQRAFEQFFVNLAKVCTRFAKDLYSDGVDLEVKVPGRKFLKKIKFSDVDLDENVYSMQVFPTSMLPKTPAARYAQIDEWVQKGWVSKADAMQLMDMPDLEKANAVFSAQTYDIEETIEQLLVGKLKGSDREVLDGLKGEDRERVEAQAILARNQPDPVQNLVLGIEKVRAQYLIVRHQEDVPEPRRQNLLDWLGMAEGLVREEQQVNGAAAAMGGMGPPAVVDPGMGAPPVPPAAIPGM